MHHEVQRLVFNVGEGCSGQVRHQMRRHTEDTADFRHGKLLRLQKLAVLWRQRNRFVGHPLLQNCHTVRVGSAAIGRFPAIPDTVRVFHNAGMFQHTAWLCAIFEEGRAVLVHRNGSTEAVLHHGDWRKTDQAIKAQTRHMEDLIPAKVEVFVLLSRHFICVGVVDIVELTALISVHFDIFRHQRIQPKHRVLSIPDDLCVGIAPEEQVGHHRFPEDKGCHFRIWLPIQNLVQRMIPCLLLIAIVIRHPVQMQRQCRNGLCQQTDTGVHGRDLHGGFFIHLLPGIGTAKHKGLPGIADIIRDLRQTFFRLFCFGRISRILKSHPFPESHNIYSPFYFSYLSYIPQ